MATEDEMVGWHHRVNGHEFEQALEAGDGQGSLACCSPWGRKESDTTEGSELINPLPTSGSTPELGSFPGAGNGNLLEPTQYSCLGNSMEQKFLVGYHPWGYRVGHH